MTQRPRARDAHHARLTRTRCAAGAVALIVGVAGTLAGCGRSDEDTQTFRTARINMQSLHTGAQSTSPEFRERTYRDTAASLRGVVDRLPAAESASALLLLGQAEAGLAELHAERNAGIERRIFNRLSDARTALEAYASHIAESQALLGYSADEEQARLRALDRELEMQGAEAAERRRDVEARVARLDAEIARLVRSANEERTREREIWSGVADASAQARAEAAGRARVIARQADELEREASELEARAATLRPQIALYETDITRVRRQRELTDTARRDLEARVGALRAESTQMRTRANEAAERLDRALREIMTMREGDLAAAHSAAVSGFTAANGSFRRASNAMPRAESRPPVALALAASQQTLAHVHASRSALEQAIVEFLDWAANVRPAPPQAEAMRTLRADADTRAHEARRAAIDAYQAARSTLQTVSARGEVGERLERLRTQVDEAMARLGLEQTPAETGDAEDWIDHVPPVQNDTGWDDAQDYDHGAAGDPDALNP